MNCLPGNHPCEHVVTNALVRDWNQLNGTSFEHRRCPDKLERNRPEPDALYIDVETGQVMVVEHKSVVWPPEYAARHRNDHLLMDEVLSRVDPNLANGRFELALPFLLDASKQEITELAKEIAGSSNRQLEKLSRGERVSGVWSDKSWQLRPRQPYEETYPQAGIVFSWRVHHVHDHGDVRPSVVKLIERLVEAASEKFEHYRMARCIVLLELTGLSPILARGCRPDCATVSDRVDEVWTGLYEYFDDGTEDWLFEEVWTRELASGCG